MASLARWIRVAFVVAMGAVAIDGAVSWHEEEGPLTTMQIMLLRQEHESRSGGPPVLGNLLVDLVHAHRARAQECVKRAEKHLSGFLHSSGVRSQIEADCAVREARSEMDLP